MSMKKALFYTFLFIYIATAIVTLLGLTPLLPIPVGYMRILLPALLVETAAALVALFKRTDFFDSEGLHRKELEGQSYLSLETVKIIDLRGRVQLPESEKQTNPASRVTESDLYRIKKLNRHGNQLVFYYNTTGYGTEGGSLSHPGAEIQEVTNEEESLGKDPHLVKRYRIDIDTTDLGVGAHDMVRNRVTFINAFQGDSTEWFHTHIDFPTMSLTFVLLFPQDKPCTDLRGFRRVGRGEKEPVLPYDSAPRIFRGGEVGYWKVESPNLGAEYQLEWDW